MRQALLILGFAAFCATAVAADKSTTLTVVVDQKPALTLQLPGDWTTKEFKGGKIRITPANAPVHIQLWNVANAKTVADALPLVAEVVKSEVTDFKAVESKDVTLGDASGKHLIGTGTEADDGDPSQAEVFLFAVGGKVFLVCAHGEGEGAAKVRAAVLDVLSTAKQP